jgi:hypothetical protein
MAVVKSSQGTITGRSRVLHPTGPWGDNSAIAWRDRLTISTSTNPKGNNPFASDSFTVSGGLVTGDTGFYEHEGAPSGFYAFQPPGFEGSSPRSDAGRKLLAMTNPARPEVLMPVFFLELRDIPNMVRQVGRGAIAVRDGLRSGRSLAKELGGHSPTATLAGANLAAQFGWQPFIGDLWKMAKFQDAVQNRKEELDKARKGIKRKVKILDRSSFARSVTWALGPEWGDVPGSISGVSVTTGGVIWKETYPGSASLPDANIRRLLGGLDAGNIAANVWEALPWSWFTDYFNNISDMIQAGNRTVATPERAWIKTTIKTTSTMIGRKHRFGATLQGARCTNRSTVRSPVVGGGGDIAHLPVLSGGQLSILGSLAVVKNRRVLEPIVRAGLHRSLR